MRRAVGVAWRLALALALMASLVTGAWAGELIGKVQGVEAWDRVLTLADGSKLWLDEALPTEPLREGATVKLSYEERDGKPVVIAFEVFPLETE